MPRLSSLCLAAFLFAAGCSAAPPETSRESASTASTASAHPIASAESAPASVPGLPFTIVIADQAPPGAMSVDMLGFDYEPDQLTAQAGTVVIFLKNTTLLQEHNMNIGMSIGEPLARTPLVHPGEGMVFTIEGLTPGSYTFWDSLYREDENAYFYELGMVGTLTITP